jgi:hypothetical protein
MADVAAHGKRKIATNSACTRRVDRLAHSTGRQYNVGRTRGRSKRVSRAEHRAARLDGVEALPNHGDDGARGHVLDQTGEERLILQILIICGGKKIRYFFGRSPSHACPSVRDGTDASGGARGWRGRVSKR